MSVEKKMVTEMREVEVEKVVLTLSMEQAAYLSALLGRVAYVSNTRAGMYKAYEDLATAVKGSGFVFEVTPPSSITVERET